MKWLNLWLCKHKRKVWVNYNLMDIKNLINQGSMYLKNNDIPTYKIDSEILMMKVIDKDKKYMILNPNEILNEKKKIFIEN